MRNINQSIHQCYTCSYEAQTAHDSHSLISCRLSSQLKGDLLSIISQTEHEYEVADASHIDAVLQAHNERFCHAWAMFCASFSFQEGGSVRPVTILPTCNDVSLHSLPCCRCWCAVWELWWRNGGSSAHSVRGRDRKGGFSGSMRKICSANAVILCSCRSCSYAPDQNSFFSI